MTDLTTPGEIGGAIEPTPTGHAFSKAGSGAWVVDGVDLADSFGSLSTTNVNGFAAVSTSGLDMTIDGGEAYVAGWLCRDRQTTYSFGADTSTTLCVGYDAGATLGTGVAPADSENIIVGTPSDFGEHDPYIELYDIETDASSVTYSDVRVMQQPVSVVSGEVHILNDNATSHFASTSNPHDVTPSQIGAYTQQESDSTFMMRGDWDWESGSFISSPTGDIDSQNPETRTINLNNIYDKPIINGGLVGHNASGDTYYESAHARRHPNDSDLDEIDRIQVVYNLGASSTSFAQEWTIEWSVTGRVVGEADHDDGGSEPTAIIVDDYERSSLGDSYWILDTGQATLPSPSTTAAYEGQYGFNHPDANPNTTVSLASTNTAYDSTNQPTTLDNYPTPNEVTELFFRPVTFGSGSNARIGFNMEGYDTHPGLRIDMDPSGYWRIQEYDSGWGYYGTDPQEDSSFSWDVGDWHRIVIDQTSFPDVSIHLWNAETGSHKSSLETSGGSGTYSQEGFMYWANADTHIQVDYINQIDSSDYTAGADM